MSLDPPSGEPTEDVSILNDRANERAQSKMRILKFTLGRDLTIPERNLVAWEPRCLAWYVFDCSRWILAQYMQLAHRRRYSSCRRSQHTVDTLPGLPAFLLLLVRAASSHRLKSCLMQPWRNMIGKNIAPLHNFPTQRYQTLTLQRVSRSARSTSTSDKTPSSTNSMADQANPCAGPRKG